MILFDHVFSILEGIFAKYADNISLKENKNRFYVNRDLRGRVALVWDETHYEAMAETEKTFLTEMCGEVAHSLGKHSFPASQVLIWDDDLEESKKGASVYSYGTKLPFTVVDRMLTDSFWGSRAPEDSLSEKTIVFFSIKGGVGRSTALAVTAWELAQKGKKVMVVDMDLESPGLSSSLLPEDRRPDYGLLDWLVEDLVDNGSEVIDLLYADSPLSDGGRGEIIVIPAHGRKHGDYIAKMGRAWMPRMDGGYRTSWPQRLRTLLNDLNQKHKPDYALIDARAGLDEIASACVLDLAPRLVLLFAMEGTQTWTGYSILFDHWNRLAQAKAVRESLQCVAAMIPPLEDKTPYLQNLREHAWDCFRDKLYDDISAGQDDGFSFDCNDLEAPHNPWLIHWHPGLHSMKQLSTLEKTLDEQQIRGTFPFLQNLSTFLKEDES